jgi:hypothetical protein
MAVIQTQFTSYDQDDLLADPLTIIMTDGGDERILIDPSTGLNRYMTVPRPQTLIAYSSSTANFISVPAMAEVRRRVLELAPGFVLEPQGYGSALDGLRTRLRKSWNVPTSVDIVFAASGTDLEYVGLATAMRDGSGGIDNILLGADEVGSGCVHAANARHFAKVTPQSIKVEPGLPLDADFAAATRVIDVPIRSAKGQPLPSEDVLLAVGAFVAEAIANNRHPLVHVVHGSKTGLVVPSMGHIDALRRRFGDRMSFVVDACQARISRDLVGAYLARGCTVFLTGSKFMGGPPFSGFALVPAATAARASALPPGLERVFCRAEWPATWPGVDALPDGSNLGLLLRLEASIFELELFHRLHPTEIKRTVDLFEEEIAVLTRRLGASHVKPMGYADERETQAVPMEIRTLATIDLSEISPAHDFDFARGLYQSLANGDDGKVMNLFGMRLGQPVRCVRMPDGRFGATLRIGLSMPQMVEFSAMDTAALRRKLADDLGQIAGRIERYLKLQQRH